MRKRADACFRSSGKPWKITRTQGAARGFSGPIVRGDVETIAKHLDVLRRVPGALEVYRALALAALRTLPVKNRERLEKGAG